MQKYKIMIVDDEVDVREGIVSFIDWNTLGFEIVLEAENGRDALEQAESTKIDVVLTDIKMPFMDGLAMSAKLSQMYPGVKIIILSGFEEFKYAKEAIKLNVVEYALKPVNVAELTEVLLRVKRLLDEDIEQKRNIDALKEGFAQSLPAVRERFLNELLGGTVPHDDISRRLALYGIPVGASGYKVVTVFEVDVYSTTPHISEELVPVSIMQIMNEQFEGRCKSVVFASSSAIIAITSWDNASPIGGLMNVVNEICSKSMRVLEVKLSAGIGHCYEGVEQLRQSFLEAREALAYKAIAGTGKAIYIDDMERNRINMAALDSRGGEQLFSAIKFGTPEQISLLVSDIFDKMEGLKEWERQAYIFSLFNTIYHIIQRYELYHDDSVIGRLDQFAATPNVWAGDAGMSKRFLDLCLYMSGHLSSKRERAAYNLAEEARHFIDAHFHESDLSVERVCEHLHVSQSYFSSVFKQETGVSYVQYLTELRMSEAVKLLQQTDDKTYMIANKIGYEDPNYFSYVFKKRFGISPAKYRK